MAKTKPRAKVRIPADIKSALKMFSGESDRSAAVLGGAYLEEVLDRVVRSWLVMDSEVERLLRNANQKVHLAYGLGIITPGERHMLLRLQAVRNFFAHHVLDATSFDHDEVASVIDEIVSKPALVHYLGDFQSRREAYLWAVLSFARALKRQTLPTLDDDMKRSEVFQRLTRGLPQAEVLAEAMRRRN